MRIYNIDQKKILNNIVISLTREEAEDFQFRINDMANNPGYKDESLINDFVDGDVITLEDGRNMITKSIEIAMYNQKNLETFSELAYNLITKDKL